MAKHARFTSPGRKKKIIYISVAAILVIAALVVILCRDSLFSSGSQTDDGIKSSAPFTFENGSDQNFALYGDDLAIASSTGVQILDKDGETTSREVFSMTKPCVCSGGKTCLFYDIGGTSIRAFLSSDTKSVSMDTAEPIISASVNSSGYFAVAAEEGGYKGSVTVYDAKGNSVYKWYSGTGYILDAVVIPDNSRLVVLCAENYGSVVHFFKLTDESEYASATLSGELGFKLGNLGGGDVCVLSEDNLHFFNKNGEEKNTFSLDGNYLADYEFTESCCALAVSKYVSGSSVTVTGFTSSGKQTGSADLGYSPASLSSQGDKLFVFGSEKFTLLSSGMDILKEGTPPTGYKSALYMPDGTAMLLASYHGEKITLK